MEGLDKKERGIEVGRKREREGESDKVLRGKGKEGGSRGHASADNREGGEAGRRPIVMGQP
jgi:hypothetical protein